MSRYLETLIAQARGVEPEIQPRMRSRFEPDMASMAEMIEEPLIDQPSFTIEPAQPLVEKDGSNMRADSQPFLRPPDQPVTEIRRETIRHVHHETERVERIVHHDTAPATPPRLADQAQATEKIVPVQRAPVLPPQWDDAQPTRMPLISGSSSATDPVPGPGLPEQSVSPRHATERREGDDPAVQPLRMIAGLPGPEPIQSRRDLTGLETAPQAPEITISIGVLDIRLTQETAPDRRQPTTAREQRESPMPLADYLARRSGGAS